MFKLACQNKIKEICNEKKLAAEGISDSAGATTEE
jgi:hypothetical protein